ncbi:MAG: hypothetical protein HY062_01680 [Bacteroidetes bacterium]|nr:hypothetical protein [Bacteroidota bacterium]
MKAILRHKGYRLFSRPFELNIVGLRSKSTIPNRFDDEIHVFYKVSTLNWHYHVFRATTDPGTFWLRQPMQPQGTAILQQGQFLNAYGMGLHQGKYLALVQTKPVTIIRDYDRDAILDFNNGNKTTGYYGINVHRANRTGTTKTIDKNSAGCQVFENADDFAHFLELCSKHRSLYGNVFTYSLIDFRAVRRQNARYVAAGIGIAGLLGLGILATVNKEKVKSIMEEVGDFFSDIIQTKNENEPQTNNSSTPSGQGRELLPA